MLKKILCLLACLPLLLTGCGDGEEKKEETENKKTLTLITSADFPPFEYFSTSDGNPQIIGFDIDIANRIADYLGYNLEIRDVDFASVIPSLQSGRADFAMAGITPTEERQKSIDFSTPYYFMNNVMVHRLDNDFLRRKDYNGTIIAVLLGSTQEQFAKTWAQTHQGIKIVQLNRVGDAIQEVLSGRADGVILDETPAQAYIERNKHNLTSQNLEGSSFGAAIAFPKGSPLIEDFNRALAHLRDTGMLDEIVKKWLVNS